MTGMLLQCTVLYFLFMSENKTDWLVCHASSPDMRACLLFSILNDPGLERFETW